MSADIFFYSEDVDFTIKNPSGIASWLNKTIVSEGKKTGEISVIFCSDEYLLEMNQKHLQHDYYTDIITFDYSEENLISGDLFISVDRVKDNSVSFGASFLNELHRVVVHGVLHLCGYGDKTPEQTATMRDKENFYLSLLSV
jgi:probable rRNA maturation factor